MLNSIHIIMIHNLGNEIGFCALWLHDFQALIHDTDVCPFSLLIVAILIPLSLCRRPFTYTNPFAAIPFPLSVFRHPFLGIPFFLPLLQA